MAAKKPSRNAQRLLKALEVWRAREGDHSDGGGLYLRVRGESASWLFRYTSATGKRREMGLGKALRADAAVAGTSLTTAREHADNARSLLARGTDPINAPDAALSAEKAATVARKAAAKAEALTLARASRQHHEKDIEPSRTEKHSVQWIASLENHIPEALWKRPIATIGASELLDLLLVLNASVPETAGRIRQRLDAIFDDAVLRGYVDKNPAAAIRRKLKEVGARKKPSHFRSLDHAQVPAFMADLIQARAATSSPSRSRGFLAAPETPRCWRLASRRRRSPI